MENLINFISSGNGYDTARNKAVTGYEQHGYTQEDFNEFRKQSLLDMENFEE